MAQYRGPDVSLGFERQTSLRIARLAGRESTPAISECVASLDPSAPRDYREIAGLLASEWAARPPRFVGLAGGQGAGKSTLGRLIASACQRFEIRVCVLSLDDFYTPLSARRRLAERVHPLLETRGPPGTHDMKSCLEIMARLRSLGSDEELDLPIFDKGIDDRRGSRRVQGPFDMVLLEGWCVGAIAESAARLEAPINSLERASDADGVWRRFVNQALAQSYARAWRMLDYLIFLRVPDIAAVRRWRLQQESERPEPQRMEAAAVDRFVQHFERTTRAMDRVLPDKADLTVELAEDHSVSAMKFVGRMK
jgi:D-glycerate 3-kinase